MVHEQVLAIVLLVSEGHHFWICLAIHFALPPLIAIVSLITNLGLPKALRLVILRPSVVLISILTYFTVRGVHCGRCDTIKISVRWTCVNMVISCLGTLYSIFTAPIIGDDIIFYITHSDVAIIFVLSLIPNIFMLFSGRKFCLQFGVIDTSDEIIETIGYQ